MSYRYEKRLPGIGVIRRSTNLVDPADIAVFQGLMLDLSRRRPEIVRLFRDRQLDAAAILRANERENLSELVPDARTLVPIWDAFERAWEHHKSGALTRQRYRVSVAKLRRRCPLPAVAGGTITPQTVADLPRVDWEALSGIWGGSPSDWMALYRMMSAFLSIHFGGGRVGKSNPFRLAVMDSLPRLREPGRVPKLSPDLFWKVVGDTPEHIRPAYVTLAGTGLRCGEFLALEPEHLRRETFEIDVPGTKTAESAAVVPVEPELWPWVVAAVPSPVQYKWLREHWARSCRKHGLSSAGRYDGPRLHDLRHCFGQWAITGGADEAAVQQYLRHSNITTTRRYTVQRIRAEVSGVVTRKLLEGRAA